MLKLRRECLRSFNVRKIGYSGVDLTRHLVRGKASAFPLIKSLEGNLVEYNTQNEVQNKIWKEIHQSGYHLTEKVPICQGRQRGELAYNLTTEAAIDVLDGTYKFSDDFYNTNRQLYEVIADIRSKIPKDPSTKFIQR